MRRPGPGRVLPPVPARLRMRTIVSAGRVDTEAILVRRALTRMLRRFLRDPTTKVALGVFIATFIYALMVLRTLGLSGNPKFVPDNAIAVVLLLLLLSMVMFLRLISKTTQGLRVAAVVKDLGREGAKVIRHVFPEPLSDEGGAERETERPVARSSRVVDYPYEPGVLQSIDATGLVRMARDADVVLELVPAVGDLVAPGEALFRVYGEGAVDEERSRRSIAVGDERTMRQDPAFVLRLLADISAKALSPGVNDPTTSVQALDQIDLLLRLLAHRKLTPGELRDGAGEVRVLYPTRSWEDFLSIGLDETRNFGASSQQVARRLRALLDDLRETAPACRQPAIEAQLSLLESSVRTTYSDPAERQIAATEDRQGLGTSRRDR